MKCFLHDGLLVTGLIDDEAHFVLAEPHSAIIASTIRLWSGVGMNFAIRHGLSTVALYFPIMPVGDALFFAFIFIANNPCRHQ